MESIKEEDLEHFKHKEEFCKKILEGIRYETKNPNNIKIFEERLNNSLSKVNKNIFYADTKKELRKQIENIKNYLTVKFESTYLRITNNKYEYVTLHNSEYIFNFQTLFNKVSPLDFQHVISEVTYTIHQENLISVINYLNEILFLENLSKTTVSASKIIKYIYKLKTYISEYFLSIISSIIFLAFFYFYTFHKFTIFVKSESQQTISLSIIGLVVAFVGFGVVFIQLSFDNFKKYFGSLSKIILFKSLGKEIIYIFVAIIIFGISTAVFDSSIKLKFSNSNSYIVQDIFFNSTLILFFIFLPILLYKANYIFDYSLSNNEISNLINSIKYNDLKKYKSITKSYYKSDDSLIKYESTSVEILNEVLLNYISHGNYEIAIEIIKSVTTHYQKIIEQSNKFQIDDITFAYCRMIQKVIDCIKINSNQELLNQCFGSITRFNKIISVYGCYANSTQWLLNLIKSLVKLSIECKIPKDFYESINLYIDCLYGQIYYNTPPIHDIQTASPILMQNRRNIFIVSNYYRREILQNILYSYQQFDEFLKNGTHNNSLKKYAAINLFKNLFNQIFFNCYCLGYKYELVRCISEYNLSLYKDYNSKISLISTNSDSSNINIDFYSPIDFSTLYYGINHIDNTEFSTSDNIKNDYKVWLKYILEINIDNNINMGIINSSIKLIQSFIINYNTINNEINKNKSISFIKEIIDIYLTHDYSQSVYKNTINNSFYTMKNLYLKDIDLNVIDLGNSIETILNNTT